MDKKKRDLIIAVVLVCLFAILFLKNVVFARKRPVPRVGPAVERTLSVSDLHSAASSLASVRENEKNLVAQEAYWEKDWGRDPFAPLGSGETASTSNLILSGIVWDEAMPVAMINEKVLRVGDVIEGYRISEIRPSVVVVVTPSGRSIEVELFQALSNP